MAQNVELICMPGTQSDQTRECSFLLSLFAELELQEQVVLCGSKRYEYTSSKGIAVRDTQEGCIVCVLNRGKALNGIAALPCQPKSQMAKNEAAEKEAWV